MRLPTADEEVARGAGDEQEQPPRPRGVAVGARDHRAVSRRDQDRAVERRPVARRPRRDRQERDQRDEAEAPGGVARRSARRDRQGRGEEDQPEEPGPRRPRHAARRADGRQARSRPRSPRPSRRRTARARCSCRARRATAGRAPRGTTAGKTPSGASPRLRTKVPHPISNGLTKPLPSPIRFAISWYQSASPVIPGGLASSSANATRNASATRPTSSSPVRKLSRGRRSGEAATVTTPPGVRPL